MKRKTTSSGKQPEPAYTLEEMKELYFDYAGDLYLIWHDHGSDFVKACHYYGLTEEKMKQWRGDIV